MSKHKDSKDFYGEKCIECKNTILQFVDSSRTGRCYICRGVPFSLAAKSKKAK